MNGFCPSNPTMSALNNVFLTPLKLDPERLMSFLSTKSQPCSAAYCEDACLLTPFLWLSSERPFTGFFTEQFLSSSRTSFRLCHLGQRRASLKLRKPHTLYSCRPLSKQSSLYIPCEIDIDEVAYYMPQSKRNKY